MVRGLTADPQMPSANSTFTPTRVYQHEDESIPVAFWPFRSVNPTLKLQRKQVTGKYPPIANISAYPNVSCLRSASFQFTRLVVLNVLCGLSQLDLIDTLCESKRAKTFITTRGCRAQVNKHKRFSIST